MHKNITCTHVHTYVRTYLRNGTEVEHTLVADSLHVSEHIRNMIEGIGDQQVETVHSLLASVGVLQLRQTRTKLTPCLQHNTTKNTILPCLQQVAQYNKTLYFHACNKLHNTTKHYLHTCSNTTHCSMHMQPSMPNTSST